VTCSDLFFAFACVVVLTSCSRSHSDDVREWRATDHDVENEPVLAPETSTQTRSSFTASTAVVAAAVASAGSASDAQTTWNSLCAGCHGQLGPNNRIGKPMVGVRDLSDPNWQSLASDSDISRTIAVGRGKMPSFTLSSETKAALTRLIRSFAQRR
jgi:mono/diheme cytochrome c family protein